MKSQERILAAFRREPSDHVPCAPHVSPQLVANMAPGDWEALLHQTDVTMTVSALGDAEIMGGQMYIDGRRIIKQGAEQTTIVETPMGELTMRVVATPEANWTAEHLIKNDEDIDRILSIPYAPPAFSLDAYERWTAEVGDEGLVALGIPTPFRVCLGLLGSEALYMRMADDPDLIEKIVALMCTRTEAYVRACCERGVRHFWMGGSEHCGPGVVHPRFFRRMITPYDRRIVAIIHEYGGTVNQHIHGRLRDILDEIVDIGCDVFSPIETGLRGDVTLAEAKARVGDRICLKGNLDDMAFLALASPDEVRVAAQDAIAQAAEGGGFILSGTDAGIYSDRWLLNMLLMADVAREHRY